jgi:Mg/Co/Ni transporter MgtE
MVLLDSDFVVLNLIRSRQAPIEIIPSGIRKRLYNQVRGYNIDDISEELRKLVLANSDLISHCITCNQDPNVHSYLVEVITKSNIIDLMAREHLNNLKSNPVFAK